MKKAALHVLLVEDNSGDARLLREMFRTESPGSFQLTHVLRLGEALVLLAKGGIDIILLDLGLPDGHGLDTVRRARAVAPEVPLIVLTGLEDEALAAEAMKEGAQDYLIKGEIENRALPRVLRYSIERQRMKSETDLIRAQQMQFKDEFLSHVSHELRSPLTAIHQFVSILHDGLAGALVSEQHRYLEIVLRNVKQLDSMINDLLDVTRVQSGKLIMEPQYASASDAIVYVINTLQEAAKSKGSLWIPTLRAGCRWCAPTPPEFVRFSSCLSTTPSNSRR
jgi:sigma-B regulation protein RsbU (phosphoserine phosphatase)